MGFFDSVQQAMGRGGAAAGRAARTMKINVRLDEITKERQRLAAQLGASLYEATREDPAMRAGREALYDGIAALDAERDQRKAELEVIKAEAAADEEAAQTWVCPKCGAKVGATDLFCSGCGTSIEEIRAGAAAQAAASASGRTCSLCGAPLADDDMFCMTCGAKVEPVAAAPQVAEPEPAPAAPVCPSCGAPIAADDKFCGGCGAKRA